MDPISEPSKDENPILWTHKNPASTRMWAFKTLIEAKYNLSLPDYEALWKWSITELDAFWSEVWHFTGVRASQPFTKV